MHRFSVNSLFPEANCKDDTKLDVENIFDTKKNKLNQEIQFNIDKLISNKEEKQEKVIFEYRKVYNVCLSKITLFNSVHKTDFIYQVPGSVFMMPEYKPYNCLEYIQEKLSKLFIDTIILSENKIFISWKDLESNRRFGQDN